MDYFYEHNQDEIKKYARAEGIGDGHAACELIERKVMAGDTEELRKKIRDERMRETLEVMNEKVEFLDASEEPKKKIQTLTRVKDSAIRNVEEIKAIPEAKCYIY